MVRFKENCRAGWNWCPTKEWTQSWISSTSCVMEISYLRRRDPSRFPSEKKQVEASILFNASRKYQMFSWKKYISYYLILYDFLYILCIYIYIYIYGWWFGTFFIFPFSWECHFIPTDELSIIFQRGRLKPPTRYIGGTVEVVWLQKNCQLDPVDSWTWGYLTTVRLRLRKHPVKGDPQKAEITGEKD